MASIDDHQDCGDINMPEKDQLLKGNECLHPFEHSQKFQTSEVIGIAENQPEVLIASLAERPDMMEALLLSPRSAAVFCRLAEVRPSLLCNFLEKLKPAVAAKILLLRRKGSQESQHVSVGGLLSHNGRALWRCCHLLDDDCTTELLRLEDNEGTPIALHYAKLEPASLVHMTLMKPSLLRILQETIDANGRSAFHVLAEQHMQHLMTLLETLGIDQKEKLRFLHLGTSTEDDCARECSAADSDHTQNPGFSLNDNVLRLMVNVKMPARGPDLRLLGDEGAVLIAKHLTRTPVSTKSAETKTEASPRQKLDLAKLANLMSFTTFSHDAIDDAGIKVMCNWAGLNPSEISAYLTAVHTTGGSEIFLRTLLNTARLLLKESPTGSEGMKSMLAVLFRDPRCVTHQTQNLIQFCWRCSAQAASATLTDSHDGVLGAFVREAQTYVGICLPAQILAVLEPLFGGAPDLQSTHGLACVRRALDEAFGLFGGRAEDDAFCPCSRIIQMVVKKIAWDLIDLSAMYEAFGKDLCEGEEKWNILRRIVGDDRAVEIAGSLEPIADDLFTFQQPDKIQLTPKGFSALCQNLGFVYHDSARVDQFNAGLVDSREETLSCMILSLISKRSKISFEQWLAIRAYEVNFCSQLSFLRMNVSLSSILACHIFPEDLTNLMYAIVHMRQSNPARKDADCFSVLWHFSFLEPEAFFGLAFNTLAPVPRVSGWFGDLCELMGTSYPGSSLAKCLAIHNSEVFEKIIFSQDDQQILNILGTTGCGQIPLVFHVAIESPETFIHFIKRRPEVTNFLTTDCMSSGQTVFHALAAKHPQYLVKLLADPEISIALAIRILCTQMCESPRTSVAINLALTEEGKNGGLRTVLARISDKDIVKILAVKCAGGIPMAHVLVDHATDVLIDIILNRAKIDGSTLQVDLLYVYDSQGWTIYHKLVLFRLKQFKRLMQDLDSYDKREIYRASNMLNGRKVHDILLEKEGHDFLLQITDQAKHKLESACQSKTRILILLVAIFAFCCYIATLNRAPYGQYIRIVNDKNYDQMIGGREISSMSRFLLFYRGRSINPDILANVSRFASSMNGMVVVGAVNCDLSEATKVCKRFFPSASLQNIVLPSVRLLTPKGHRGVNPKSQTPPGIEITPHLDEMERQVAKIFMKHRVTNLSSSTMLSFVSSGGNSLYRAVLFTHKTKIPIIWKVLSVQYAGKIEFGMATVTNVSELWRWKVGDWNISRIPAILCVRAVKKEFLAQNSVPTARTVDSKPLGLGISEKKAPVRMQWASIDVGEGGSYDYRTISEGLKDYVTKNEARIKYSIEYSEAMKLMSEDL